MKKQIIVLSLLLTTNAFTASPTPSSGSSSPEPCAMNVKTPSPTLEMSKPKNHKVAVVLDSVFRYMNQVCWNKKGIGVPVPDLALTSLLGLFSKPQQVWSNGEKGFLDQIRNVFDAYEKTKSDRLWVFPIEIKMPAGMTPSAYAVKVDLRMFLMKIFNRLHSIDLDDAEAQLNFVYGTLIDSQPIFG